MNKLQRTLEKAIGLMQQRRFADARPLVKDLAKKAPRHPLAWNLLGVIASEDGHLDKAIDYFKTACVLAPRAADFHNNLGEAYRKAGRYDESLPLLQRALELEPMHAAAHNNIGAALNALHREEEAAPHLGEAIKLRPDNHEAYTNLGIALVNQRKPREAVPVFEIAYKRNPDDPVLLKHLGNALEHANRFEEALELFRRAEAEHGPDIGLTIDQVSNLERQRRYDEAWARLEPLLESAPDHPGVGQQLAVLAKRYDRQEEARERLVRALGRDGPPDEAGEGLYFALGKLCDSMRLYDEAFEAYRHGNELNERPYNHAAQEKVQDAVARVYAPGWVQRLRHASNRCEVPVFIVGMPRSGTTLTEQILDCHPAVYGAGELTQIGDIAKALAKEAPAGSLFPDCMAEVGSALLDHHAERHLAFLGEVSGGAARVVDKLPHNHKHLGLIQQLFPTARVIHCTRNPVDTCLSCYFQNFYAGHGYAYDLESLGAHYRLYERAMAHWRKVCDLDTLVVKYEELVADQERISREMVAFLGLPWDDRCLHFHESERRALTASYDQVRQPIYTRSVSRYEHYEKYLGPLFEALASAETADVA